MSSHREGRLMPEPGGLTASYWYDARGRLQSVPDGKANAWAFQCGPCNDRPEGDARQPKEATIAARPCVRHSFEFGLAGSETQQQTLALDVFGGLALAVAIERVWAFLSGAETAGPASAIGGIDVQARLAAEGGGVHGAA